MDTPLLTTLEAVTMPQVDTKVVGTTFSSGVGGMIRFNAEVSINLCAAILLLVSSSKQTNGRLGSVECFKIFGWGTERLAISCTFWWNILVEGAIYGICTFWSILFPVLVAFFGVRLEGYSKISATDMKNVLYSYISN